MDRFGFLIDMDGVVYQGKQLVPGADTLIKRLLDERIPFTFLTNNSQRTRRDVATKLARMGIRVSESHIYTCAMATARFLASQKPGGTAFVIGEGGLTQALHQNGYSIVDDDPDSSEPLSLLLQAKGHQTRIATDGDQAISVADEFKPNCVLLDLGLPRMDGYEVARRIRERPYGNDVVLVALTGWAGRDVRTKLRIDSVLTGASEAIGDAEVGPIELGRGDHRPVDAYLPEDRAAEVDDDVPRATPGEPDGHTPRGRVGIRHVQHEVVSHIANTLGAVPCEGGRDPCPHQ